MKMMRAALLTLALCAVATAGYAQALAKPPTSGYGWRFTAAGTPVADSGTTLITFSALNKGPTSVVFVANDNSSGGSDLFIAFNSTTIAGAPTDGTTASTTLVIPAGKEYGFDGRYTILALRSSSGNSAARVYATFDKQ